MRSAIESIGKYAKKKEHKNPVSKYQFVYTRIYIIVNNLPFNLLQSRENMDFGLLKHTHCKRDIQRRRDN